MSVNAQNQKFLSLFRAVSVATDATTIGYVDTKGFDYASFVFDGDTTSTNPQTLDLTEGTNSAAASAIAAFTGDSGFTIPAANTNDGVQVLLHVDLRNRERYMAMTIQADGAGQLCSAWCILSRSKNAPITDAERVGPGTVEVVTG